MKPQVGVILRLAGRRQYRRRLLVDFMCHVALLCLLWCVCCLLDSWFSLRESTAGWVVPCSLLLASLSWGWRCACVLRRGCTASDIASAIEKSHPDFRDSLHCALELEARGNLNDLEQAVVAGVSARLGADGGHYVSALFPVRGRLLTWAGLLAGAAGLFLLLTGTRWGSKARHWLGDRISGQSTGLMVLEPIPGSAFITHSDVGIRVRVTRWEREAMLHSFDESGEPLSFPLQMDAETGEGVGTLYDVSGSVRFKVTTPSFDSGWREHDVYDRPSLTSVRLWTEPQGFTGLPSQSYDSLCDLGIVSGDGVGLVVSCSGGENLRLQGGDTKLPLSASECLFRLVFHPSVSEDWALEAEDAHGRFHVLGRFSVTVSPDLPPEIERLSPEGDVKLHSRDSLRLHVIGRDDFGLRSLELRYRVAGGVQGRLDLRERGGGERSWEWNRLWDLTPLGLSAGDVITCVIEASDNHRPVSQRSRSSLFFVTIQPDVSELESSSSSSQREMSVDFSDLLSESKRLLRQTWDLCGYDEVPPSESHDLAASLGYLQLEIGRRESDILKKAGIPSLPGMMGTMFSQAKSEVGRALDLVRRGDLAGSLGPQERGLQALAKLEAEALKNKAKSDRAKSGKEQGKGCSEEEQKSGQSSGASGQKVSESQVLQAAIETLRGLLEEQERLNRLYGQNALSASAELRALQRDLRSRTRGLDQSLLEVPGVEQARGLLNVAMGEMSGSLESLGRRNLSSSLIHGRRALQGLSDSLAALESAQRSSNRRQVERLSRKLSELSRRQRAASEHSRELAARRSGGADDVAGRSRARSEQDALNRETGELGRELAAAAEALEGSAPRGAEALRSLSSQLRSDSLTGSQRRALNSLLYRRYERAHAEQSALSSELSRLSSKLAAVSSSLPLYGSEELRRALGRLQEDLSAVSSAQRLGSSGSSALSRAGARSSRDISSLGRLLGESSLEELGRSLSSLGSGSLSSEDVSRLQGGLRHAVSVGAARLRALEGSRRHQLHRERVSPPDKYRRQVEDYFRQLAE